MSNTLLTVEELINLLADCPPDAKVLIEGCDCWGTAEGVISSDQYTHLGPNAVMITRLED